MIQFEFDEKAATQAAARFIKAEGGSINHMKLIKLLYMADREALKRWGRPLTGDDYFSMKHGPVLSSVLDLVNYGCQREGDSFWCQKIGSRGNHRVSLIGEAGSDHLSEAEAGLLDETYARFGGMDQWELADYCHEHFPEWADPGASRSLISVEEILSAVGRSPERVEEIRRRTDERRMIDSLLD